MVGITFRLRRDYKYHDTLIRIFALSLMTSMVSGNAHAALITGFGDPLSDAALFGGSQEGFDTVPNQIVGSIALGNVTYTGIGAPLSIGPNYNGSYNTTGGKSMFNDFDYVPDAFSFGFGTEVSAFGFNWGASNNTWLLETFDSGGVLIEFHFIARTLNSNAGDYFGVSSATGIRFATITDLKDYSAGGDYVFIDRFTDVSAVPLPAALPLFLSALGGLGFMGWRSRRKKVA